MQTKKAGRTNCCSSRRRRVGLPRVSAPAAPAAAERERSTREASMARRAVVAVRSGLDAGDDLPGLIDQGIQLGVAADVQPPKPVEELRVAASESGTVPNEPLGEVRIAGQGTRGSPWPMSPESAGCKPCTPRVITERRRNSRALQTVDSPAHDPSSGEASVWTRARPSISSGWWREDETRRGDLGGGHQCRERAVDLPWRRWPLARLPA